MGSRSVNERPQLVQARLTAFAHSTPELRCVSAPSCPPTRCAPPTRDQIGRRGCLIPVCGPPYRAAMAENPTAGGLYKAKVILEADVMAAVEAVLAGRPTDQHPLADGYTIDLVAAVDAHPLAKAGLAAEVASLAYRRNLARTAILLARPSKNLAQSPGRRVAPAQGQRARSPGRLRGRRCSALLWRRGGLCRVPEGAAQSDGRCSSGRRAGGGCVRSSPVARGHHRGRRGLQRDHCRPCASDGAAGPPRTACC